jgi:hypothetical protein
MYAYEKTSIEGIKGHFQELDHFFKQQGFEVGGGWEYDHAYYDKQLEHHPGYLFLRIPAYVEEGEFGERDAVLRLGAPFLLRHKYQIGLDDNADAGLVTSFVSQFSEPEDADASVREEDVRKGEHVIGELEQALKKTLR